MSSKNRLEANRHNAHSFDGREKVRPYPRDTDVRRQASGQAPKTEEGKRRATLNATRHGLTGQVSVMTEDDRIAHNDFCDALIKDLAPRGAMQQQLATRVAEDSWRLNRVSAIEDNIFALGFHDNGKAVDVDDDRIHVALTAAVTFTRQTDPLKLLSLYEQRLNRSIEKNLKLLRHLQADEEASLETKAALREKALEEARLLHGARAKAATAQAAAATHTSEEGQPNAQLQAADSAVEVNGFVFSNAEIAAAFDRHNRLQQARKADSVASGRSQELKTRSIAA
jgi:hypothetical protein